MIQFLAWWASKNRGTVVRVSRTAWKLCPFTPMPARREWPQIFNLLFELLYENNVPFTIKLRRWGNYRHPPLEAVLIPTQHLRRLLERELPYFNESISLLNLSAEAGGRRFPSKKRPVLKSP